MGHDAKVGSRCIIYLQVTIAGGNVVIGDWVELGAGAKALPNVRIRDHCHVGANAVVVEDMPDYSTCVIQIQESSSKMRNTTFIRQSNFELLRILCMFGVITGHALQSLYELHTSSFSVLNTFQILLMNACVLAVNCFVMISGYFRIKQSWKGITGLWLQLLFYAFLSFVLCLLLKPEQSLLLGLKRMLFPLSESGLWFIVAYFGLYLCAPIINAALDGQSRNQKLWSLALLLIVDVYLGYMHQVEEVTINGYHIFHFIVIYWLGNCMKECKCLIDNVKVWGGGIYTCHAHQYRIACN